MTPTPSIRDPKVRKQSGFTLVELMVSVIIGLLLAGSLVAIVVNSTSAYNTQLDHARVYENARFALEFISRDVRMAGYFGCVQSSENVINNLNATDGSLYDIDDPLEGFENDGSETTWSPSGASVSSLNIVSGSDAITLRFANPTQSADIEAASSPNSPIDADDAGYEFAAGGIAVVADCDKADLFRITAIDNDNNLSHASGGDVSPSNTSGSLGGALGDGYDESATVMSYNAVRYFVRKHDPNDTSAGAPVGLYRQYVSTTGTVETNEIIEGIENMQILYGVDTDGDGRANSYIEADDVGTWRNVVSVQVALLARSNEEYGTTTESGASSHTLLGTTVTDSGALRVRRHQFSTTIELRNTL